MVCRKGQNFSKKERAMKIYSQLRKAYPKIPRLFLNYRTKAQMLAAIMLSAQSTDAQTNKITKELFKKYKTVNDFASASRKTLEKEVFSSGFYKSKSRRLIECFKKIRDVYGGKIPRTLNELVSLPGVGRKTANLVLAADERSEGIAVDTHVSRLSYRFGFSETRNPEVVERMLACIYPQKKWIEINGLFILHGRKVCTAKKPFCSACFLNKQGLCPRKGVGDSR